MDRSDIPDEGTNVEELMRKIKENIKTRRAIDLCANAGDMTGMRADEAEGNASSEKETRKIGIMSNQTGTSKIITTS